MYKFTSFLENLINFEGNIGGAFGCCGRTRTVTNFHNVPDYNPIFRIIYEHFLDPVDFLDSQKLTPPLLGPFHFNTLTTGFLG